MVSNVDLSIEQIQELLGVTVDGKLGPQTKDAIKAIQRYGEIAADGIPGPQTTSVLRRLDPNEVRAIVKKFQKPEQKYQRAETKAGYFQDDAEPKTSASDAEVKGEAQRYAKLPDAFLTLMEKNGLQILTDSKDPLPSSMYPTLATEFSLQVVFDSTDVQYWLNGLNGISTEIRNDLATKIGTPSPISIPLYVSQPADLFEGDSEFSAWCQSSSTLALRIIEKAGEGNELNGQLVNADGKSISMQSEGILAKVGQSILRSWPELIFGEEIIKIAEEYRDLTIKDNNLENETELDDKDPAGLDLRATTTVQAGYAADGLEREDKLNLEAEVRALCAIIAARDVEPPLSIGLFGNWGTGKSFFMKEMMTCIRQMATTAREVEAARERGEEDTVEPDYWSNIAQIKFNAWHYEDADLWANLVVRIFDKLAKHVTTGETDPDIIRHERQKLLDEFQSLANEISEKEEEVKQAAKEHEVAERERAKARIDLEKAERELKQINLKNIGEVIKNRFLADQTEVKKYLDDFGMGDAVESAEKLKFQMSQLRTEAEQSRVQVGALWAKVQTVGGVGWLLAIIILIFVAGLMIPAFIDTSINKLLADAIQLVTQLAIGCGGLFVTLRSWLKPINQKIGQLAAAAKDYEKLQSQQTAEHAAAVNAADAIVEELHENLENKESELAEKHERLANLEYDLKESKAGRRLHRFLEQRAASDDYRGKLGIVASIREDFSQLSKMLYKQSMSKRKAWTEPIKELEDTDSTLKTGRTHYHDVDRIVLYIDDLDRCEPSRVIEVLHAVHLLLAFKLFVVVVAVDSRWLVNSLKQSLKNLSSEKIKFVATGEHGTSKEDQALADNLVSTPQNYLEKIFQIPFTLAPMNRDGLKSILEQLAAPLEIEDANDQHEENTDSENLTDQTHANIDQVEPISESTESEQVGGLTTNDGNIQKEMNDGKDLDDLSADTIEANKAIDDIISVDAAEEASANVNENTNRYANIAANLPRANINRFELEFMYHAFGGLRTPRAANRFVNTYRLIRSLEPDQNKEKFFDKEEGEYKIAISMLILLVGFPTEADPIFQKLVAEKPDSKWEQLLGKIKLNNSQLSTQSRQKLAQVVGNIPGMKEAKVGPYQKWAHKVARYAFRPIELPAKNDKAANNGLTAIASV